jgi:hypothetical protein
LPQSLTGTIAPNNHGGLPLLQTPIGLLSLETATDLPPGATVTVEPLDTPTAPVFEDATPPQTFLQIGDDIEAAVDILRQTAPHMILPEGSSMTDMAANLATILIGLTAAVDSGSARPWLGDRLLKTLAKDGHKGAIERMEKDLAALKSPVRMPIAGDWQCLILPLPLGQRIERIRLIVRRNKGDDENDQERNRDGDGARFLLDVDMSRLGALQIDGLLQRKTKRFDVILRTRIPLANDIRQDIKALFSRSLDGMGMVGGASFQTTPTFIEPLPVAPPDISGWVI